MNFQNWTTTHTFALIRSALIGALTVSAAGAMGYLESVPAATLTTALTSKSALFGLLGGAAIASLQAVLNLAKTTFVKSTPAAPPLMALCFLFMLGTGACTGSQQTTLKAVTDVAGNVCQVVVTATDPSLTPICTTATEIANAIESLIGGHAAALDAGTGGVAGALAVKTDYVPTNAEVYAWLVAHGAKPLGAVQ